MGKTNDPYDDAFAEGVQNWNLLVIQARIRSDPAFEAIVLAPEAWRACEEYARTRYLGLLSSDELFERYRMLFVAQFELDAEGLLSPHASNEWHAAGEWADKWVHAATEIALRDLRLDDQRARPDWSFIRTLRVREAVAASRRRTLDWGSHPIVKYGDVKYLRPALEAGSFRISPASWYDDPSMNVARRDVELERTFTDPAFETTATLGPLGDRVSPEERSLYTERVRSAVDYYIFCLAGGYQLRLFDDFDANACLVITDSVRFLSRLREAVANDLPGWHYGNALVQYIDPVQTPPGGDAADARAVWPFFTKHHRYHYQREIRVAWLPPSPAPQERPLDPITATLGSLEQYCELVELGRS